MPSKKSFFKLFSDCIPVKGYKESLIYDLTKGKSYRLPNLLFDIFNVNDSGEVTIAQLKKRYGNLYDRGIDAFFQNFSKINIGFFTDTPKMFPGLQPNWDSPYLLTNAILEISNNSNYSLSQVLNIMNLIGVPAVEIRFLDFITLNELKDFFLKYSESRIRSINLCIPYYESMNVHDVVKLFNEIKRISGILIHSMENAIPAWSAEDFSKQSGGKIFLKKEGMSESENKKKFFFFTINVKTFHEAKAFNLGLNRKITVNWKGEIKNFLTHQKTFGNVTDTDFVEVSKNEEFKEKWKINNDLIKICKDCQFRYMCIDNCDIVEVHGMYEKVEKCDFNPFENKWHNNSVLS